MYQYQDSSNLNAKEERLDLSWYWYMYFNAKEERLDLTWY
jgi:hypothetical protein